MSSSQENKSNTLAVPEAKRNFAALVAEDNPVNQEVILALLEDFGIHAKLAKNGRDAVDALSRESFDLVFMDCQMPEMNGFEATAYIREQLASNKNIPIIAMTANSMLEDKDECLAAGMNDYMPKPIRKRDLKLILERWLEVELKREVPAVAIHSAVLPNGSLSSAELARLRHVMGENFERMLTTFIESAGKNLKLIAEAVERNDAVSAGKAAHSLKSAGQVGAMGLYNLAAGIEKDAKAENLESVSSLLAEAMLEYEKIQGDVAFLTSPQS